MRENAARFHSGPPGSPGVAKPPPEEALLGFRPEPDWNGKFRRRRRGFETVSALKSRILRLGERFRVVDQGGTNEDTKHPFSAVFQARCLYGDMLAPRFFVLAVIIGTCASLGCLRETPEKAVKERVIPVSAIEVCRQDSFSYPIIYYGRIEPARRASLSFEFPGLLSQVLVDEGQRIEEGQVLANLDTSLLEADRAVLLTKRKVESTLLERLEKGEREEVIAVAQAEVKRREVDLRQKEADRTRAETVYKDRAISKADYDAAVYAHEAAKLSLEQALKRLEELETGSRVEDVQAQASRVAEIDAQLARLSVQFEKSVMQAPFAAVCVRRHHDEGVILAPGDTLLDINEVDRLEARFSIPQPHLEQVSENASVQVQNESYPVKEMRVVSEVDESTRGVDVVIPLQAARTASPLPGQTCSLQLIARENTTCLKLPITSLVPSVRGLWSCYRLRPTEADPDVYEVEKVEVSIIHSDGKDAVVTAALDNGERIIPNGVHKLAPGMLVRIVDADS